MLRQTDKGKIDFSKSEQYILSICLSTDGFSFSVRNPICDGSVFSQARKTEPEKSLVANLKQAFKELEFLSYTYKQVNISLSDSRFTLMPLELFDENMVEPLFYYNYSVKKNEVILYNASDKIGAVVIYGIDKSLYNLLNEYYPDARFYSSATFLAEHFLERSRQGDTKKMYVFLHPEFIELYSYERGHLMLLNTYGCKNTADRLYYLLYAWKQLAMDQQKDELFLTGDCAGKEDLEKELKRFVSCVSFIAAYEVYPDDL